MYTSNSCWSLFKCCLFPPMIELLKVTRATWPLWYTDGLSQTMPRQTDVFQQRFSRQQAMLVLSKKKETFFNLRCLFSQIIHSEKCMRRREVRGVSGITITKRSNARWWNYSKLWLLECFSLRNIIIYNFEPSFYSLANSCDGSCHAHPHRYTLIG